MTIFSEIPRDDPSRRARGDGQFAFLNRVAGTYWDQVRELIEDWFSHLCPDAQADIGGRLRSTDDRHVRGAFFELYLHECLLRMGYTVTCHPVLEGTTRRPDFLAEKEGRSIYIEAHSPSESDVSVGAAARINTVYDSLDKLDSPNFFLWIDVVGQGPGPLRARPLRNRLERWLRSLNPDSYTVGGRRDDLPFYHYEEQTGDNAGWIITFWAVPRPPDARGRNGARPLGIFDGSNASWGDERDGIRGALSDKGVAYGALSKPFVVAVASTSMSLKDDTVLNALYGTGELQISISPDGAESYAQAREPDGYWYAGDHWDHRGVSAVLVVKRLHPAFVGRQTHTIWEHPDPHHPVDAMPLWRRCVVRPVGQMEVIEPLRSQAEWFDLGTPWPVGDPGAPQRAGIHHSATPAARPTPTPEEPVQERRSPDENCFSSGLFRRDDRI
ncbi:hypothetical protein [Microbacterium sp.]|uniref:hypothetical protein n=1 Tax=Microbacterium sp. TaxID=51671 RepID=UPI003C775CC0